MNKKAMVDKNLLPKVAEAYGKHVKLSETSHGVLELGYPAQFVHVS